MGYTIDPLRFRANFYIDGAEPWEEFDWVGSDILIGDVLSGSTAATAAAGPPTSIRHRTPRSRFAGRCARLRPQGSRHLPDRPREWTMSRSAMRRLAAAGIASVTRPPRFPRMPPPALYVRRLLFIYEQAAGTSRSVDRAGYALRRDPVNWRCPDCGTDKTTFRPHVEAPREKTLG